MKIKTIKSAKNILACMVAVELYAMHYFVPPYMMEKNFELVQPIYEEDFDHSRKLSKRKNNPYIKPKKYTFEG